MFRWTVWIASGKEVNFLVLAFCSVAELRVVTSSMLRPVWSYWRQDLNMIFCMCGICRHSWMATLPSSQGTASGDWHLWLTKERMIVLSISCLEHLCSQKLILGGSWFWVSDCPYTLRSKPVLCPGLLLGEPNLLPHFLASKALCWGLGQTHFLLGFVLHSKLHVI